jgi:hypothetical protein
MKPHKAIDNANALVSIHPYRWVYLDLKIDTLKTNALPNPHFCDSKEEHQQCSDIRRNTKY